MPFVPFVFVGEDAKPHLLVSYRLRVMSCAPLPARNGTKPPLCVCVCVLFRRTRRLTHRVHLVCSSGVSWITRAVSLSRRRGRFYARPLRTKRFPVATLRCSTITRSFLRANLSKSNFIRFRSPNDVAGASRGKEAVLFQEHHGDA